MLQEIFQTPVFLDPDPTTFCLSQTIACLISAA
jgi:hypothetical protein